jgi:hypothetical protein
VVHGDFLVNCVSFILLLRGMPYLVEVNLILIFMLLQTGSI